MVGRLSRPRSPQARHTRARRLWRCAKWRVFGRRPRAPPTPCLAPPMLQKNYVGHGSSQGGLYRHLDLPSWSLGGWYSARRRASTERCVALLRVRRIGARARVVGLVPLKSDSEALEALSGENVLRLHGERVMVHAVPQKGARILPRGRGWYELLPLLGRLPPAREREAPEPLGAWRGRIIHHQSPPPRCAWAQGAAPLAAGPGAAGRADIARRGRARAGVRHA